MLLSGHMSTHHSHREDHARAPVQAASERRLGLAALLTACFLVVEVVGALLSGSLALLADAGHMLTDVASLGLAWFGFRLARRPADWKRTYGFDRFSILVAFVNGLALFVIAGWIVVEAFRRLSEPIPILGGAMLAVALGGLAVNIAALWVLWDSDHENLNVRAAALHVVGDLLASVATVAAAIVIFATGWARIDPILSLAVSLVIVHSAWQVVRDSGHILLEGAPSGVDAREIRADLKQAFPQIVDVHHVHAWSITSERTMMTLHARVCDGQPPERIAGLIKERLQEKFGIGHATIEIEFDRCADEPAPADERPPAHR